MTIDNFDMYVKLQPEIQAITKQYFKNMDEIEELWRFLRKNDFPLQAKERLWVLCQDGMTLFWKWTELEKKIEPGYRTPPSVPCFKRSIMLLEKEKRWLQGIRLCDEAMKWIDNEWYTKKRNAFLKKLQTNK